jgi:hypothetical protein
MLPPCVKGIIPEDLRQTQLAASVIERAQELERGVGREPDEHMTLGEALEIFGAHGEPVPEHLDLGASYSGRSGPHRLLSLGFRQFYSPRAVSQEQRAESLRRRYIALTALHPLHPSCHVRISI